MDINVSHQPVETTPRLVKKIIFSVWLQYFFAIIFLFSGVMTGVWLLVLTGLITQYLIRPLVRWYLIE